MKSQLFAVVRFFIEQVRYGLASIHHQLRESIFQLEKTSNNDTKYHFFNVSQFLAHDTDFSSPLPRYEFQGVVSDVWLPIEVPKVRLQYYLLPL